MKRSYETDDDTVIYYGRLARLFRSEIVDVNLVQYSSTYTTNLSQIVRIICPNYGDDKLMSSLYIGNVSDIIHAYLLPDGMHWPTYNSTLCSNKRRLLISCLWI